MRPTFPLAASVLVPALLLATPALAQTVPAAPTAAASADGRPDDDIVVTARQRIESAERVPIALSVTTVR